MDEVSRATWAPFSCPTVRPASCESSHAPTLMKAPAGSYMNACYSRHPNPLEMTAWSAGVVLIRIDATVRRPGWGVRTGGNQGRNLDSCRCLPVRRCHDVPNADSYGRTFRAMSASNSACTKSLAVVACSPRMKRMLTSPDFSDGKSSTIHPRAVATALAISACSAVPSNLTGRSSFGSMMLIARSRSHFLDIWTTAPIAKTPSRMRGALFVPT